MKHRPAASDSASLAPACRAAAAHSARYAPPFHVCSLAGQCAQGLRSRFPTYAFPVTPYEPEPAAAANGERRLVRQGFGLLADGDPLWTEDREKQSHQVGGKRAGACTTRPEHCTHGPARQRRRAGLRPKG